MRIIAIDPGYDRCGIAILEKQVGQQKESIVFSECFVTSRSEELSQRLYVVGIRIADLIKEYTPQVLVTEDLFFAKNTKTALGVSQVKGIITFQALSHQLSFFEYTPNQIKLAVAGHGSASKDDVHRMTERLVGFNLEQRKDDEIDAIAIGLTFFARENTNMLNS